METGVLSGHTFCPISLNDSITPDDLIVFGIEPLFKEDKSNHKGNCYGHNDQKQELESMLLTSFT